VREKLAGSIRKALADRPVQGTEVDIMVGRIQARLRRRGPEIASSLVGQEVLAALRRTDEVAYLRFASVYKEFEGVADFERELDSLQKKESAKRRRSI
jgi:transcriptional repressor NrdR